MQHGASTSTPGGCITGTLREDGLSITASLSRTRKNSPVLIKRHVLLKGTEMPKKLHQMEWTTADGRRVTLAGLETAHLMNIASLLVRRNDAYNRFAEQYPHLSLGELTTNGYTVSEWLKAIAKVLAKRVRRQLKDARETIERLS